MGTSEANLTPVVVIAGPTASGKSALAVDVAEAVRGTVINADSMQVYRELRVLTARPSPADEARAPHRLFGVLPAAKRCSVGRWLAMAVSEIQSAREDGRVPVVVGGTGLYLKALIHGLTPIPIIPANVRAQAEALHARLGGAAFRAALAALDPESAGRLRESDPQRLIRAYEVAAATGRPIGDWRRSAPASPAGCGPFVVVVVRPPRETLYASIDVRFDRMIADGVVDEVRTIVAMRLDPSLPAMKAVGVRELAAALDGNSTMEVAVAAAKQASRNYAKRQLTWLRHQLAADVSLDEKYSESFRAKTLSNIRRFLLTRGARPST
ncbi:MAG: tRNA (adenosine(37)-N6)-dimethylallyltransferase MiaA [Rhodospirillales bacterium]|nr:tRNA (adenosine(37)-N6)-dimethylallyltransferase MiaA [Rhodospirillales bacterium]